MTEREREAGMAPPWSIGSRWWLAALVLAACASPALTVSSPGPGVPKITGLVIEPARIESGCLVTLRIDFEDVGGDVVRAVTRWRARTGYQRYHEGTEVLSIAAGAPAGRTAGRADVVIVTAAGRFAGEHRLEIDAGTRAL